MAQRTHMKHGQACQYNSLGEKISPLIYVGYSTTKSHKLFLHVTKNDNFKGQKPISNTLFSPTAVEFLHLYLVKVGRLALGGVKPIETPIDEDMVEDALKKYHTYMEDDKDQLPEDECWITIQRSKAPEGNVLRRRSTGCLDSYASRLRQPAFGAPKSREPSPSSLRFYLPEAPRSRHAKPTVESNSGNKDSENMRDEIASIATILTDISSTAADTQNQVQHLAIELIFSYYL